MRPRRRGTRAGDAETVVYPDIDLRVVPGLPPGTYAHADGTPYPPSPRRS